MSDTINPLFKKIENDINDINELYEKINSQYKYNNIHSILNMSVTFYEKSLEFIALSKHVFQHQIVQLNTEHASIIIENMIQLKTLIDGLRNKRDKWLEKSELMQDLNFAQIIENGEEHLQNIEDKVCYFLRIINLAKYKEDEACQPKMIKYKLH